MSTSLERLDSTLFQSLAVHEAAMILGGAAAVAGKFTFIGLTNYQGSLYNDYEWDAVALA